MTEKTFLKHKHIQSKRIREEMTAKEKSGHFWKLETRCEGRRMVTDLANWRKLKP